MLFLNLICMWFQRSWGTACLIWLPAPAYVPWKQSETAAAWRLTSRALATACPTWLTPPLQVTLPSSPAPHHFCITLCSVSIILPLDPFLTSAWPQVRFGRYLLFIDIFCFKKKVLLKALETLEYLTTPRAMELVVEVFIHTPRDTHACACGWHGTTS